MRLICGFPGIGKSEYTKNAYNNMLIPINVKDDSISIDSLTNDPVPMIRGIFRGLLLDSDPLSFSHINKSDLLKFYRSHILKYSKFEGIQLLPSHSYIRDILKEENLKYELIYPDISLKDEYIDRYIHRKSSELFISKMKYNWDSYILSCENDATANNKIILQSNQFLSDIL